MTGRATLEGVLVAALDADAGDLAARSALADLYEEQGRVLEAAAQRWLIEQGKWPTHRYGAFKDALPWDWWADDEAGPLHAIVPGEFYYLDTPPHRTPGGWRHRYATRDEAEAAYVAWVRSQNLPEAP